MEENLALPVAAEVHMDSAPVASFVAEKNCGAHSELVDFYFAGVRHLSVSIHKADCQQTPSQAVYKMAQ